jgi:hypothetical protein
MAAAYDMRMPSSTFEKLHALKDSELHALGDEILPRISPAYHPIVPHGRNAKNDSIRGQPDSYVGASAASCRIAIQYTVQQKSWWTKIVDDVAAAREACPKADKIVIVVPRDVDRERPTKGDGINWHYEATRVAEPAKLTVINGRNLEQLLDTTCQDLRFFHLGLPFSRLCWRALSRDVANRPETP